MPIEKRWVVKPQGDSEAVAKLASVLRISPVLANLLVQRGIDTVEKADKFFKPSLADLHDPFLMTCIVGWLVNFGVLLYA